MILLKIKFPICILEQENTPVSYTHLYRAYILCLYMMRRHNIELAHDAENETIAERNLDEIPYLEHLRKIISYEISRW